MRNHYNNALGFIETVGMVPAVYATDTMLKAAGVDLVSYENVGSTLVAVMISGDVGAVKASMEAGANAAAEIGKLTAQNVLPRPAVEVNKIAKIYDVEADENSNVKYAALGLLEAFGIVFVMQAVDAMIKAAAVRLIGFENVASGYISVVIEGDVAACKSAVEAGVNAVNELGAEVYSHVVIPSPHKDLYKILERYALPEDSNNEETP